MVFIHTDFSVALQFISSRACQDKEMLTCIMGIVMSTGSVLNFGFDKFLKPETSEKVQFHLSQFKILQLIQTHSG